MWRVGFSLGVALLLLLSGVAHAGALAEVSHGINRASDNDDGGSPGGGGSDDDSSSSGGSGGGSVWVGESCCAVAPDVTLGYGYAGPPATGDMRSTVYAGVTSVKDSDGAVTAEAFVTYEDFGLGVRGTSFYEQLPGARDQWIHVDLWWLGGLWRFDDGEDHEVWLEVGLGGLNNNDQLTMNGLTLGVHLDRRLASQLSLMAGGRRFWLEDGVAANELVAGVRVSILQVSYRLVDFNVGPPLQGPEVGLSFTF